MSEPRVGLAKGLHVEFPVDSVLLGVSLLLSSRVRNVVEKGRLFVVELFRLLVLGHFLLEVLDLVGRKVKGLGGRLSRLTCLSGLTGLTRLTLSLLPRLSRLLTRFRSCLSRCLFWLGLRLGLGLRLNLRLSRRLLLLLLLHLNWCSDRRLGLGLLLGLLLLGLLGLEFGLVLEVSWVLETESFRWTQDQKEGRKYPHDFLRSQVKWFTS